MIEGKGQVVSISNDFINKKVHITVSMDSIENEVLSKIKSNTDYNVIIKKLAKKRSLDANGYLWVLCTKIAEVIGSSKDEVYEDMLKHYGQIYQDENGQHITMTVLSIVDVRKLPGHWLEYKNNDKFTSYLMLKGSSEYDTQEMARLLDGVVYEAKELGIQTETPDEIARMKHLWGNAV